MGKSALAVSIGALLGAVLMLSGCASQGKHSTEAKAETKAEKTEAATEATQEESKKSEAKKTAAAGEDHVECVSGDDKRVIHVERKEGGGCEVHYTKFGQKEVVASATQDQNHCSQIRDRIRTNLTNAGFSCQ